MKNIDEYMEEDDQWRWLIEVSNEDVIDGDKLMKMFDEEISKVIIDEYLR